MSEHTTPLSPEREKEIRDRAARTAEDPFFVSDCQGELQVWRESALKYVRRNDAGEITMWSLPGSYRSTDQVIEIELDSWDPGEDEEDDRRRRDIGDLVMAREDVPALLAEVERLRARVADLEAAAYGTDEVRLLDPVSQIRHLHSALAAQQHRADTLDRIAREAQARVAELEATHVPQDALHCGTCGATTERCGTCGDDVTDPKGAS